MQRNKVSVSIRVLDEELIPAYATPFASGCDVRAAIQEPQIILPGKTLIVPTGVHLEIPEGFEIQVRPRSGFAAKNQITVLNTPGTIDSDYRGEISVILINLGEEGFTLTPKMRIAQFVLCPVFQAEFTVENELTLTQRGEGKFGHTGEN